MLQTVLFAFGLYKEHPEKLWTGEKEAFSPAETIFDGSDQCPSIKEKLRDWTWLLHTEQFSVSVMDS